MSASAIIVAAGNSSRMRGVDKLYTTVGGLPLLAHTLRVFDAAPGIEDVVLVVAPDAVGQARSLVGELSGSKVTVVVPGGRRRQDSVAAGLAHLRVAEYVVVHDGARPLVTPEIIERGLQEAAKCGAAVAAVPVVDTIKEASEDGTVTRTLDRARLWSIQTPQVFRRELLERAHREVVDDVTDDAAMVERLGAPVRVYQGAYENLKVTAPPDLALFEALLARRAAGVP